MMTAAGVLGWTEAQFWSSSLVWFRAAIDGFNQHHAGPDAVDAPDADEVEDAFAEARAKGLI